MQRSCWNFKENGNRKRSVIDWRGREYILSAGSSRIFRKSCGSCRTCPAGLFFRGKLPCPDKTAVAVVGARQCSHYGRTAAGELGAALAKEGIQVISGLALGIDGTAQQAACEAGGESYGVLGCGPDICYPQENFRIYGKVLERGRNSV